MTDPGSVDTLTRPLEPKYWEKETGVAPIKAEYVQWDKLRRGNAYHTTTTDDDAAEGRQAAEQPNKLVPQRSTQLDTDPQPSTESHTESHADSTLEPTQEQPAKKQRLSGAQKKALARQRAAEQRQQAKDSNESGPNKKKQRGQNKARTFHHKAGQESIRLCTRTSLEQECTRPGCNYSHDIKAYLDQRKPDIQRQLPTSADDLTLVTTPHTCFAFKDLGQCPFGYRCRFASTHLTQLEPGQGFMQSGYKLVINHDLINKRRQQIGNDTQWSKLSDKGEFNHITLDTIKNVRRTKAPLADAYLESIGERNEQVQERKRQNKKRDRNGPHPNQQDERRPSDSLENETPRSVEQANESTKPVPQIQSTIDEASSAVDNTTPSTHDPDNHPSRQFVPDMASVKPTEKRRLDWRGKLYLAPLTTVGNEPFRRLCSDFGNDIFCSEMGLAQEFLNGNANEWSLVRRHPSEQTFGVQVCGSRPSVLVPAAEQIVKHCDVDFIDVNCGCPIDLVFNKGAGSALMTKATKLGQSLIGMSKVLGETPLTIKIRTGLSQSSPFAHKLIPNFQTKWGLSAMTIHGRSRQQRYKTRADYAYIKECARVLRETAKDQDLPPIPIFGNGDAYDWRAYHENLEQTDLDGIMIARGGLIKPWIFTEIKEKRDWDISARERLDMIGKLCDYGLEHWGSDQVGVNHVRRFVCESLSFTHRYVPVGLLERFPVHMNERALPYKGRNELETLLSSDQASDWVKITEMFLGPAPDDWSFLPKHKAAAAQDGTSGGEIYLMGLTDQNVRPERSILQKGAIF
ncbi:tRNA-dihydrouridine synthase 3 [Microbotryomycetes sp. JL221]|nr:tRNA-dihydrouridine synthase 3 [Microbotryomycetes sp. JL221]